MGQNDARRPRRNAIPRSIKKTAIAFALAGLTTLAGAVKAFSTFLFLLIAVPVRFLALRVLRPIVLCLYKWSFPLRLWLRKLAAPAKSLLYPLTTRSVGHFFIGFVTLIVMTNSLAAKELKSTEEDTGGLLRHLVRLEGEETLTTLHPQDVVAVDPVDAGALNKDATLEFLGEDIVVASAEIAALEKPLLSSTTPAGRPRDDIETYTVEGGDTVSTIASQFGVSSNTLLWANDLSAASFIKPRQELKIPPVSGVLHVVKAGETVGGIANKYKADANAILEFNQLADAVAIEPNQTLMVPGGEIEPPPAPVLPSPFASIGSGPSTPPPSVAPSGSGLQWPTGSRRINRGYFGYHRALDIDGKNGSPVYAADDGRVETVNYTRYGYGYHVIINHGGGLKTLYAHNGKMYVQPGQSVSKGQTIATIGMTGYTTGAHLHFEVFVNGVKVNPWGYLNR
ncbi:MAG: M23 family metallopeptidase [Candidatus Kerfeldbacteria bacterium]|nr:M23 family metallopeptidase [Candidatus Kerfeldbacteria bacterium]